LLVSIVTGSALRLSSRHPESQGISSAALGAFVEEAEQKLNALHSLMVVQNGQVVTEGWRRKSVRLRH